MLPINKEGRLIENDEKIKEWGQGKNPEILNI